VRQSGKGLPVPHVLRSALNPSPHPALSHPEDRQQAQSHAPTHCHRSTLLQRVLQDRPESVRIASRRHAHFRWRPSSSCGRPLRLNLLPGVNAVPRKAEELLPSRHRRFGNNKSPIHPLVVDQGNTIRQQFDGAHRGELGASARPPRRPSKEAPLPSPAALAPIAQRHSGCKEKRGWGG
jgi:hypothetical protein